MPRTILTVSLVSFVFLATTTVDFVIHTPSVDNWGMGSDRVVTEYREMFRQKIDSKFAEKKEQLMLY
jgi:hypothetical protein